MKNRKDINLKNLKALLLAEQEELQADAKSSEEARQTVTLDQTTVGRLSRMDALQGQAMALETDRRRHVELHRVESALERMGEGDYGFCVNCDKKIAAKRLEHDPATPLCIDCAELTDTNHHE